MDIHIKIYRQIVTVEVSVEVYEYLDRANHKTENLFHEQRRHWDGREFDEYIVAHECSRSYYETPEDWLCRKETLREITAALENCTAKQRYRFLLYAFEGLSCSQIGMGRCKPDGRLRRGQRCIKCTGLIRKQLQKPRN